MTTIYFVPWASTGNRTCQMLGSRLLPSALLSNPNRVAQFGDVKSWGPMPLFNKSPIWATLFGFLKSVEGRSLTGSRNFTVGSPRLLVVLITKARAWLVPRVHLFGSFEHVSSFAPVLADLDVLKWTKQMNSDLPCLQGPSPPVRPTRTIIEHHLLYENMMSSLSTPPHATNPVPWGFAQPRSYSILLVTRGINKWGIIAIHKC